MGAISNITNAGLHMNALSLFGTAGRSVDDWIRSGYTAYVETVRVGLFGWRTRYRVNIVAPPGRTIFQSSRKKRPVCDRFARNFNAASLSQRRP